MGECEIVTLKVRGLYSKCENITNLRLKMGGERRAAEVELVGLYWTVGLSSLPVRSVSRLDNQH